MLCVLYGVRYSETYIVTPETAAALYIGVHPLRPARVPSIRAQGWDRPRRWKTYPIYAYA